jgi:acetolactate synthase I/II/III large subunit
MAGLVSFSYSHIHSHPDAADLFYDHRYSHTRMINPDFVMLAKAMGVHAIRVSSASELPEKMKEFLEYDGNKPVLLECIVETNEHVFPMVRPSS